MIPLILLSSVVGSGLSQVASPPREGPPNVIYVLADDLGYGELGCYGQSRIRTPNLDRLAAGGMRFTQHYSGSPVCAPSRCVLLTGRHTGHAIVRNNSENGGFGADAPEGQYPLPEGTETLATRLSAAGYRTAALGKWGLGGPETTGHPNHQGFDLFLGYLCQRKAHNYYPTHLWRNGEKLFLEGNPYFPEHQRVDAALESPEAYWERYAAARYAPDLMIQEALDFVRRSRDEPFFLYFATPVPHAAIQVPPEELEAYPEEWDTAPYLGNKGYLPHPSPRRGYAAMVTRFDRDVGRLLDLLDELGLAEDTIVLFSSDNGPTYNGGTDSSFFESTAGLRGLKGSLYEGGIRVPFLVRWPGKVAAGSTSDLVCGFQDVLPTVLELAGAELPGPLDGLSLVPTLLGEEGQPEHEYLYWEHGGKQALRAGRWKALRTRLKKGDLTVELYDLASDPTEARDVAAEHPAIVARMEARLADARVPSERFPLASIDDPEGAGASRR